MASTKRNLKPIDTIWKCPDDLWDKVVAPVIEALDPPAATGRKRVDLRPTCRWHHLCDAHRLPMEPFAQRIWR